MKTDTEIAIVGGGPAGLSAALVFGRSRRLTTVFDAGAPRNAPASGAHNLYTRDGTSPLELNRIAREQLTPYPGVTVRDALVEHIEREGGVFHLRDASGHTTTADYVILATGVVDVLPPIEGLRELWGRGVFHCPYCHGWEVRGEPFVLIAQGERALHLASILVGWSPSVTLCPIPSFTPTAEQRAHLETQGVHVRGSVRALEGDAEGKVRDVVLTSGERLGPAAVFTSAPIRQRSPFPEALGCTLHGEGMFEGLVEVDERGFTGVPGLFVVGDAAQGAPMVVAAAYEGTRTAAMLNNEMLMAGRMPRGATLG